MKMVVPQISKPGLKPPDFDMAPPYRTPTTSSKSSAPVPRTRRAAATSTYCHPMAWRDGQARPRSLAERVDEGARSARRERRGSVARERDLAAGRDTCRRYGLLVVPLEYILPGSCCTSSVLALWQYSPATASRGSPALPGRQATLPGTRLQRARCKRTQPHRHRRLLVAI